MAPRPGRAPCAPSSSVPPADSTIAVIASTATDSPPMRTRRAPRPNATLLCRRIAAAMAKKLPELAHVKPARVVFVAGEARRGSPPTIQPLAGARGVLQGNRAHYRLTLGPKFVPPHAP